MRPGGKVRPRSPRWRPRARRSSRRTCWSSTGDTSTSPSPDDWAALAADLSAEYGRVDALVNNAGVAARERLPHVTLETWHKTFDINVTGPLLGIQALVPLMPAGSSIVNICSVAAAVAATRRRRTPPRSGRSAG